MKKKPLVPEVINNRKLIAGVTSPADIIRTAVAGKADLTQLKELLAIQKDWEANEAKKIFASAFAAAQEKIAVVLKTKTNPQTHSKYAALDDIIESAKPVYTKEGFAVIFYEGVTAVQESIRICADVLHKAGHKETYFYDVPLDGKGIQGNANMTKIHGKASSTSYGRRYLMCMIWNIPTQDDNDGNGATVKPETERPLPRKAAKGLPEDIKAKFAKAKKLLGEEKFLEIIGNEGYSNESEVIDVGVATQILRDMGEYYEAHRK